MTRLWRRRRRVPEPDLWEPRPGVRVLAGQQDLDGAVARAVAHERAAARHLEARIARYDAMSVSRAQKVRRQAGAGGFSPLLETGIR